MIDFESLTLGPKPNQFLLAPVELCKLAEPHQAAPVYPLPLERLERGFLTMLDQEPRIEWVESDEPGHRYEIIQRTAILRFADRVTIQFFSAHEGRSSTLAVYSRSQIGYSDLGVNKRRVLSWLDKMEGVLLAE